MKKKGFTLIELLAVIIVLAVIALIGTPIVTSTIKNAKKGSAEIATQNYIRAVGLAVSNSELNKKYIADGEYTIDNDGNLIGTGLPNGKLEIDASGDRPTDGTIVIKNGEVTTDSIIVVGDYEVVYDPTTKNYQATEKKSMKTYANGEIVYFNVTTGEKCSSSDYTTAQSNTGVNSGCMKFYAFNDSGRNTVNLILDHNTTAAVAWVSKADYVAAGGTESDYGSIGKNDKGPLTLLAQLKTDTASWEGTKTPANYTIDQTGQKSNAKYTINYSSYKARLITANEIAQITGNTTWDEKTANSYYYFDSKTTPASDTCKEGNTSGCKYGWLYDRTYTSCKTYGCSNNSDKETYGYWTSSSHAGKADSAWHVFLSADVVDATVSYSNIYGVRPVIEVLKSKLS